MHVRRCVAFVLAVAAATQVFAAEKVATVEQLSGMATATGTTGTRDLAVGADLFMQDRITTGPDAKLLLRFIDNSTVGQSENAELVINHYVFSPDKKEENQACFRILKGAFRFVTDQITKLNPEGYSVEANYGSIGIRGCDLGFRLEDQRDNVYIITLTGTEEILLELNEDLRKGREASASLLVRVPGTVVGLSPLDGLTHRPFDPAELGNLVDLVAPELEQPGTEEETSDGDQEDDQAQPQSNDQDQQQEQASDVDAGGENAVSEAAADWAPGELDAGMESDMATDFDPADAVNPVDAAGTADEAAADIPIAPQDEEAVQEAAEEQGLVADGGTETFNDEVAEEPPQEDPDNGGGEDPIDPGDYVTTVGDQYTVDSASGADWSWGLWGQDTTTTGPDGSEFVRSKYGVEINGDYITADEQLAIATGTTLYNLAGSGPAAAVVTYKNDSILLQGDALFHVRIGQTVSPIWDGTFNLDGANASLDFSAQGSVNMDGSVSSQSIQGYTLNAFGFSLNPSPNPEDSVVSGSLVGPGSGPNPISGIVVEYRFNHPNAPSVVGAAGADLH